jgi:pilus assembly protein CpaC
MKYLTLLLFGMALLVAPNSYADLEKEFGSKYLILYIGIEHEETLSALPPGAEFRGDHKTITKVALAREYQKLRFTPVKPGIATMTINDKTGAKIFEYRIEVRDSKLTRVVREMRALLSDIEGITIKIVNDKVVVDGKIIHPEDMNRIVGVLKQYAADSVASLVEVSPFAQQKIAEIIEREINNPDVQVKARNGKYILSGEVNSQFELGQADLIARTYVPPPMFGAAESDDVIKKKKEDPVVNLLVIRQQPEAPPKKLIQIVIHYVELSKDYSKSSRFQWTPGITDSTAVSFTRDSRQPSGVAATITGTINNLLPHLNWAKAHGFARILQTTDVITEQGVMGMVSQSTQIPFVKQTTLGASTVDQAKVEITSRVTPDIQNPRSDLIHLVMEFTIGSLIAISSSGPITSHNTTSTTVNVRSGESAAVAGLIRNAQTMDYNKVPDTVQNPLFSFYNSKAFQKNQSQFVVFITPVIKSSASSGTEKIKEKFRLSE